jgi:hypothetical protein
MFTFQVIKRTRQLIFASRPSATTKHPGSRIRVSIRMIENNRDEGVLSQS